MKISKRVKLIIRKSNRRFFFKEVIPYRNKKVEKLIYYFNLCHFKV